MTADISPVVMFFELEYLAGKNGSNKLDCGNISNGNEPSAFSPSVILTQVVPDDHPCKANTQKIMKKKQKQKPIHSKMITILAFKNSKHQVNLIAFL
jgi:hypothetical protein